MGESFLIWSSFIRTEWHPNLGMGDVLSLIEKAGAELDEEKAKKMADKMKKAQFDLNDYLTVWNRCVRWAVCPASWECCLEW